MRKKKISRKILLKRKASQFFNSLDDLEEMPTEALLEEIAKRELKNIGMRIRKKELKIMSQKMSITKILTKEALEITLSIKL